MQDAFERIVCSFTMPDFDAMIRLLERHGDSIDVNRTGKVPYTALERACSHGRLDAVMFLVARGADIDLQSAMMYDDFLMFMSPPPVVYAIDSIDVLEFLVDSGVRFEYTLKHIEKSRVFNILTTTMIKFGSLRRLGADRKRLLHKMLDRCGPTALPPQKEIMQIVLKYHHVFFQFMPHLAALGVRFDGDFDFYDMELLPNRKNRWWECPRVIACLLRRCTDGIMHKNIYDTRRRRFFTLYTWLPQSGLLNNVEVVNSLSPRTVLHYYRHADTAWQPELAARFMRVRFLCFRLFDAHVRRRYHPDRCCFEPDDDEVFCNG